MKPMKLTSLMVMLLVGFSARQAPGRSFFDDVYFSSQQKKIKKEKTEEEGHTALKRMLNVLR